MSGRTVIRHGRILDPASRGDRTGDLVIEAGVIREITAAGAAATQSAEVIEAKGRWVTPGFVDLHVHLREPGQEYKEDIASGSAAAAAGGFTTIVAMPNTEPVIDNGELVHYIIRRGEAVGLCRVMAAGAVTAGQGGQGLAPFGEIKAAGAVAVTDDGRPVADANLMRRALEYARDFDLPVLSHAEEPALAKGGHMHEGVVSTRLGLGGIPGAAEDVAVARDIALADLTCGRLHICHVSTAGSVELIRRAKAQGLRVIAEAAPHHFSLNHEAVESYDTRTKMNPPLREEADRQAIIAGLADGTLDAIATDHAPHSSIEKDVAYDEAKFGLIGLQTALPLTLALVRSLALTPLAAIERLTFGPSRVLGLSSGSRAAGAPADVVVLDPEGRFVL
ncbi:MAG: dihydroorotase, partial [Deltaproteobacteria bacterium]|nr:dihydroorotase [Deltaproteobacteria bacterium]